MSKKKDVHSDTPKVPPLKTSSPIGHEEVISEQVEEMHPDKGAPPSPKRPGPSENPVPKPNTPGKKERKAS